MRKQEPLRYPGAMEKKTFRALDRAWLIFIPLFTVLLGLDQFSKACASATLTLNKGVPFGFSLSHNDGAVFGIDLPIALIFALSFGILGVGTFLVWKEKLWRDRWHLTGLALLLAGALGNLIDRARFGYVVDFIKVYWWPTFNLADAWIVIALFLFAWEFLIREDTVMQV